MSECLWRGNPGSAMEAFFKGAEPTFQLRLRRLVWRADDLFCFMRLSCFLFFLCYPAAPYKRKVVDMELMQVMIDVWSIWFLPLEKIVVISVRRVLHYKESLVCLSIYSWDSLRQSSFSLLLHFCGFKRRNGKNYPIGQEACSSDAGALTHGSFLENVQLYSGGQ